MKDLKRKKTSLAVFCDTRDMLYDVALVPGETADSIIRRLLSIRKRDNSET